VKDREHLIWIHERLVKWHGEDPLIDFLHKLRAIIKNTPADKESPNIGTSSNIEQLMEEIEKEERPHCQKCGRVTTGLMTQSAEINGNLSFYKLCVKCALNIDVEKERADLVPRCQRLNFLRKAKV